MFADQLEFEVAKNTETSLKKLTNNPSNTGSLIPDLKYLRSVWTYVVECWTHINLL